jgi:hypothetical protein
MTMATTDQPGARGQWAAPGCGWGLLGFLGSWLPAALASELQLGARGAAAGALLRALAPRSEIRPVCSRPGTRDTGHVGGGGHDTAARWAGDGPLALAGG